jgi:hypothetical protein
MQGTIDRAGDSRQRTARDKAYSIPLADVDVSHPELFKTTHLDQLAINIRKRSAECLDYLPKNSAEE